MAVYIIGLSTFSNILLEEQRKKCDENAKTNCDDFLIKEVKDGQDYPFYRYC